MFLNNLKTINPWLMFFMISLFTFSNEAILFPVRKKLARHYIRENSWDHLFDHLKAFHHGGVAINNLDRLIFLFQNMADFDGDFDVYKKRIEDAAKTFKNQTSWQLSELKYILKDIHWDKKTIRRISSVQRNLLRSLANVSRNNKKQFLNKAERIITLVKNLEKETKQIYQKILPHFQCYPVQIINEIIKVKFENINIELKNDCERKIKVLIKGFELGNIVADLIANGLQACGEAYKYNGKISTETKDGFFIIDIMDNGKGIAKSKWDKIFEKGYSTKSSISGFGLFYAKETLARYGGKLIVLRSEAGKGTVMRLSLKIV